MNYKECEIIAKELDFILKNGAVQKIHEGVNGEFFLTVYVKPDTHILLININPPYPRIHLTKNIDNKTDARNFTMYLRKHIAGKRIKNVYALKNDRIIVFEFDELKLLCELMPVCANIFVLDNEMKIQYSVFPVEDEFYIIETRENVVEINLPELNNNVLFNEYIDEKYSLLIYEETFKKTIKLSLKLLNKEKERILKKIEAIKNDKGILDKAKLNEKMGNLIKSNLHNIKKGLELFKCIDYETGEEIEIKLDAKLTPNENMLSYFKKSKKAKTGSDYIIDNEKRACKNLSEVEEFINKIQNSECYKDILQILNNMGKSRYLKKIAGNIIPKESTKSKKQPQLYKCYTNETGKSIYVGRNDIENDKLTFTFAKGRDYWLHVADYPGSHVVVPVSSEGEELDNATLRDAGLVAVHYSKAKGKNADVHFTRRKYVSKSKGMKKGLVTLSKFKSIFIKYDSERLRDLNELSD